MTDKLVSDLARRLDPRAASLVVTVFGDTLRPRGGAVWLGSLIAALAPLSLSERRLRTAVYRLVQDGTLVATQRGRRSDYALTEDARRQFERVEARIYGTGEPAWDGRWLILWLGEGVTAEARTRLRRELGWQGFAPAGPNLLVHTRGQAATVRRTLADLGLEDAVVLFDAQADDPRAAALPGLVAASWDLESLAEEYRAFLSRFRPAKSVLARRRSLDPQTGFLLRTLLVHEHRRLLLRDPTLPAALLPRNWPGHEARDLAAVVYRQVTDAAEMYVDAELSVSEGPLPEREAWAGKRFTG